MSRISTANREGTSVSHDSSRLSLAFTLLKMPAVAGPVTLKSFWSSRSRRAASLLNVPTPWEYRERVEATLSGALSRRRWRPPVGRDRSHAATGNASAGEAHVGSEYRFGS